jgi:TATA-binding protein-associated factor
MTIAASALEALHKQVLPFLLRRLKEDVLHDLPPKIIQDYYCDLSEVQRALYDEFSRSRAAEEAGEAVQGDTPGQGHVFQSLQYLRKLCNHPALVLNGEPARFAELQKRIGSVPSLRDISHAPKLEALK